MEIVLSPRVLEAKDWAAFLFVFSFALIAVTRTAFETRFNDFLKILVSDKYIKVYKDTSHLMSGFTILLFIVQVISFSFFIQLSLAHFGYVSKTDWILFIRIFTFFGVFVLSTRFCFSATSFFYKTFLLKSIAVESFRMS